VLFLLRLLVNAQLHLKRLASFPLLKCPNASVVQIAFLDELFLNFPLVLELARPELLGASVVTGLAALRALFILTLTPHQTLTPLLQPSRQHIGILARRRLAHNETRP
jgi:hypothetical protein